MGINIFSILGAPTSGNGLIPARDPGALTGSAFIAANMNIGGSQRETNILNEFLHGNVPDFLRHFTQVSVNDGANSIDYLVMPDYLSVGTDSDYCRLPMGPLTAQSIANKYDCTLPTTKMVYQIWEDSPNKVPPSPWGPPYDQSMEYTSRYGIHNQTIQNQIKNLGFDYQALTSGQKKDIVLTNKLYPNNPTRVVAIYGWIQKNGQPIQGLNTWSHSNTYADYSHGARMVANDCMVNGTPMRMKDVFLHPVYSKLVSDEGPLKYQSY